jgi:hypothetical protein
MSDHHECRCYFSCTDCGACTKSLGEGYMVTRAIWLQAWPTYRRERYGQFLCIGCLESRLGRTLTKSDFTPVPLNSLSRGHKSERLRNRLTSAEERNQ